MKFLTPKFLLVGALLLGTISSQADTVKFSAPAEYCFPQTSIKSEFGKFDKVSLDHNVIIQEEDHFKIGDIFVGFRRKSQPDVIWLTDGVAWTSAAETPIAYPIILPNGDGKLQPIMPISLSSEPIDASAYIGDGEIWVGYGLKAEGGGGSFEDMMRNQRFKKIWEITGSTPSSGLPGDLPVICLITSEMKTTILTTDILPVPNEVILNIDSVGIATKP